MRVVVSVLLPAIVWCAGPASAPAAATSTAGSAPQVARSGLYGIDTSTALTPERLRTLRDATGNQVLGHRIRFIGRYVSVGAAEKAPDLDSDEVRSILASGYLLAVFQRALANGTAIDPHTHQPMLLPGTTRAQPALEPSLATGKKIGQNAVSNARGVRLPPGTQIFLDLENINPSATNQNIAAYATAWAGQVRAAGYSPGLYLCRGMAGMSGAELLSLPFDRLWKGLDLYLASMPDHAYAGFQPEAGGEMHVAPNDPAHDFTIDADFTGSDDHHRGLTLLTPPAR